MSPTHDQCVSSVRWPAISQRSGAVLDPRYRLAYTSSHAPRVRSKPLRRVQSGNHRLTSLLRCHRLSKAFPGVQALSGIDFELQAGEVHAVVGENGAGKSTLMHLLAGVYQPDSGSIEIHGHGQVGIIDESQAQALGIAIVYQERSLFPLLSVAENIFVNCQGSRRRWLFSKRTLIADARALLRANGFDLDPAARVKDLSPAEQQIVEIAKALSLDSRVLILDEPTASLTFGETDALFAIIERLKVLGTGIIYISHRLE